MNSITETNNNANMSVQATTTAVTTDFTDFLHSSYVAMIPWFIAAIPLILLDLRLGIARAKKEQVKDGKKTVTFNKAVRMTIDKSFTYICWIMLSTTLSLAFDMESIKFTIMAIVYGLEVCSCISNWLFVKYDIELDVLEFVPILFRFLWNKLTGMEEDFKSIVKSAQKKDENTRKNNS